MGRAQPCAGCLLGKKMGGKRWGLLCSAFFTRKIFRAADRRDYAREKSGVPQRFASWRNLLAVSSSDRAYQESPGRVSDRARWAGTSLCPHGMFFDGASKCGHRDVPAHLRRGPLTWVWADDCLHTLTHWKERRTIFVLIFLPSENCDENENENDW